MQVETDAQRFDQQLSRRIVEEEGQMQSFFRNFFPFLLSARALLPGRCVVEKARFAGDGGGHRVGTGSHAVDFDQSQGSAPNARAWGGQQQPLAGEQLESDEEKIEAAGNRDRRKNREVVDRDEKGKTDGHSAFRSLW